MFDTFVEARGLEEEGIIPAPLFRKHIPSAATISTTNVDSRVSTEILAASNSRVSTELFSRFFLL